LISDFVARDGVQACVEAGFATESAAMLKGFRKHLCRQLFGHDSVSNHRANAAEQSVMKLDV
jgi:hypothetical protein